MVLCITPNFRPTSVNFKELARYNIRSGQTDGWTHETTAMTIGVAGLKGSNGWYLSFLSNMEQKLYSCLFFYVNHLSADCTVSLHVSVSMNDIKMVDRIGVEVTKFLFVNFYV